MKIYKNWTHYIGHAVTNSSNAPQGESTNQPLSKAPRRIYKLGVQMYIHSNKQFLGTFNCGEKVIYINPFGLRMYQQKQFLDT